MANANTETTKVLASLSYMEVTLQCEKGHSQDEIVSNPSIVQDNDGLITLGEFYYSSGWHFCDGCEASEEEDASRSDKSVRNGQIEIAKQLGYQAK